MHNISAHAAHAREAARQRSGQFGFQQHTPPSATLPDQLPPVQAELTAHFDRALPDAVRCRFELAPHPFQPGRVLAVPAEIEQAGGQVDTNLWSAACMNALPAEWTLGDTHPFEDELETEFRGRTMPRFVEFSRTTTGWEREVTDGDLDEPALAA